MQVDDLLRDCQTQAGAASFCTARRVQTEELFKNTLQLGGWYFVTVVNKRCGAGGAVIEQGDCNRCIGVAVIDCALRSRLSNTRASLSASPTILTPGAICVSIEREFSEK